MKSRNSVTSLHEASHAFLSRLLLLGGGPASILASADGTAGWCLTPSVVEIAEIWKSQGRETYLNLTPVHARIVIAMAGTVAELEFCEGQHCGGHEEDWQLIHSLADGDEDAKQALFEFTQELVHRYRNEIIALAGELKRHLFLTGEEIDDLCEVLLQARATRASQPNGI